MQLLRFWPACTRPHVRNTLIAFLIIANREGKFAFIASSHLSVGLRYLSLSLLYWDGLLHVDLVHQ